MHWRFAEKEIFSAKERILLARQNMYALHKLERQVTFNHWATQNDHQFATEDNTRHLPVALSQPPLSPIPLLTPKSVVAASDDDGNGVDENGESPKKKARKRLAFEAETILHTHEMKKLFQQQERAAGLLAEINRAVCLRKEQLVDLESEVAALQSRLVELKEQERVFLTFDSLFSFEDSCSLSSALSQSTNDPVLL